MRSHGALLLAFGLSVTTLSSGQVMCESQCPGCRLPCRSGSCTNYFVNASTEESCHHTSHLMSCGACKPADASREILSQFGIHTGFVTLCPVKLQAFGGCPGLGLHNDECDERKDCAKPPHLTQPVCVGSICRAGDLLEPCEHNSDCRSGRCEEWPRVYPRLCT